jgi:hypothetical protein
MIKTWFTLLCSVGVGDGEGVGAGVGVGVAAGVGEGVELTADAPLPEQLAMARTPKTTGKARKGILCKHVMADPAWTLLGALRGRAH